MVRIRFDNENVYVNYCNGQWYAQPLDNSWLWVIGAIRNGERIEIYDNRKELQDHQYDLSCIRGGNANNHILLKSMMSVFKPERKGVLSTDEADYIRNSLLLRERTTVDLKNLRAFIVAALSVPEDAGEWDLMSAITHCIDMELFYRGEEV